MEQREGKPEILGQEGKPEAFGREDFPVWDQLTGPQRELLAGAARWRQEKKGALLRMGGQDCQGLFVVRRGMLRAFMLSDQGREVTLYRLGPGEICLFSASCMLHGISADLSLEAERDCGFWVIPPGVYRQLMEQSLPVAGYTNQIMGRRFSQVTWLVEQVLFRGMDQRLAAFLLEESRLEGLVSLARGRVELTDPKGLERLAGDALPPAGP